jgi:hypothetical protein
MRALAYLLGARALDVSRDAERGIRWPKPESALPPLASTPEMAAAWRRWRDDAARDLMPDREAGRPITPSLEPNRI